MIAHAVKSCLDKEWLVEYACCIYPCVPFLESNDLIAAFYLLQHSNANFIYPVTEYAHPLQRAMRQLLNGQMQFVNPEYELTRTQDLEKTYHDCG